MKIYHFICWFLITATLAVFPINSKPFGEISPQLKLIVTVEGKSFFADDAVNRSWAAAGAYCESLGMKLASIKTATQFSALNASYSSPDFTANHWTDGRDALALRQFSWNRSNEALSGDLYYRSASSAGIQSCLGFVSTNSAGTNGSYLFSQLCSYTYKTLCET